jgi:hypothetical protein
MPARRWSRSRTASRPTSNLEGFSFASGNVPVISVPKASTRRLCGDGQKAHRGEAQVGGDRDMWMVQRREHFRFALKSGQSLRIARQCRRQDLNRRLMIELGITRLVTLAHSARPNPRENFMRTELVATERGICVNRHSVSGKRRIVPGSRRNRHLLFQIRGLALIRAIEKIDGRLPDHPGVDRTEPASGGKIQR